MKNKAILTLLAVVPLFVWSCAKTGFVEEEELSPVNMDPWTVIPAEKNFVGAGNLTVGADFGGTTKSQTVLEGSHASVIWTAGDTFEMSDQEGGYTNYSTSEDGAKVSFSGGAALSTGPFISIYPASASLQFLTYLTDLVYVINIPDEQAATIGSVAEEANVSMAKSATQDEDLHFQNLVSLVKFKLSGSIVSQVKKVSILGTDVLSGPVIVQPTSEGVPEILAVNAGGSESVSLSGNFVAGQDYYIAVAPGYHTGFSMTFANAGGTQKINKYSPKALTLNRSRITDLGTIDLGDDFDAPAPYTLYMEHTTTPYATIAVVPDGYTSEELDQYELDAKSGIDALFDTEPYKTYKGYFNVYILKVASNESGARISDGTEAQRNRDCFFQSSWKASKYDNMRANDNRVFQFVEDNCPDIINGTHDIKDVPVLIMINDTRFGGIAWNYSNGQTYCMVPKTYGTLNWSYPGKEAKGVTATRGEGLHTVTDEELTDLGGINTGTWRNTLVHEFGGHSIGKLGDEYWYDDKADKDAVDDIAAHGWTVPMSLNVSAKSAANLTPWAVLFTTDVQTRMAEISPLYAQRISVFQGADVSTFNRWRSEKVSCMIDNRFYFSTWQRYILVNRIMTLAGLSALSVDDFLDHDVPTDPNRDGGGGDPVMRPLGVSNRVPPRPVPMLPPPRYVEVD